jgi:hypothetical protein
MKIDEQIKVKYTIDSFTAIGRTKNIDEIKFDLSHGQQNKKIAILAN